MKRLRPLALLLVPLLVGCATYATIENRPLGPAAAAAPGYAMDRPVEVGRRDDITLVLAFSGGGIRSATFNLGVAQALADYARGIDGNLDAARLDFGRVIHSRRLDAGALFASGQDKGGRD